MQHHQSNVIYDPDVLAEFNTNKKLKRISVFPICGIIFSYSSYHGIYLPKQVKYCNLSKQAEFDLQFELHVLPFSQMIKSTACDTADKGK